MKGWVFLEDMRKIAPEKIGRAMILPAIENLTGERVGIFKG
jgi:hypothetical protein